MQTVDIISADLEEPIILVKGFRTSTAVDIVKGTDPTHPSYNETNHINILDPSFEPPVYKRCAEVQVPHNANMPLECNSALRAAARSCYDLGHASLARLLEKSTKRKYWDGPSVMVYGVNGEMSGHRDKADLDLSTSLPRHDGFLVTTNLGLTCHFTFRTRPGHTCTVAVPSGSVLIFDAVLTEHAIHTVVPDTCPSVLAGLCPQLASNRISVICRQSLDEVDE